MDATVTIGVLASVIKAPSSDLEDLFHLDFSRQPTPIGDQGIWPKAKLWKIGILKSLQSLNSLPFLCFTSCLVHCVNIASLCDTQSIGYLLSSLLRGKCIASDSAVPNFS